MSVSTSRRNGMVLAALLALTVYMVAPLATAGHDHSHRLTEQCALCILSTIAVDQVASQNALPYNSEDSEYLPFAKDAAASVDLTAEQPTRAPPEA
jgi:hypothetical protein